MLPAFSQAVSFVFGGGACVCCQEQTDSSLLCSKCKNEYFLKFTSFSTQQGASKRCSICGKYLLSEDTICFSCQNQGRETFGQFDKFFPIQTYVLWKKNLVFEWKTKKNRLLTYPIQELFLLFLKDVPILQGLPIVPVPPRPEKIKAGFDQVQDLCKLLKKQKIKVLDMLKRLDSTQQKKLSGYDRLSHVQKSYTINERYFLKKTSSLPPAVILLDDVMTTGATLQYCCQLLKQKGIKTVYGVALFYV